MSMQEEDDELTNLSPETVLAAIDAVKGRAWDINPFTVADELKVSRSLIYRHAEAMKLIVAARGGSFGMDMQTSLELTWQLRKLEQDYSELKQKLASNPPEIVDKAKPDNRVQVIEPPVKSKFEGAEEVIFNLASNDPYSGDYSKLLANMSWKDVETIYDFKVASLKDYAANLFGEDSNSESYNQSSGFDSNKHEKLNSGSPFAQLRSSRTKISQGQENLLPQSILPLETNKKMPSPLQLLINADTQAEEKVQLELPAEPLVQSQAELIVQAEPIAQVMPSINTSIDSNLETQFHPEIKIEASQADKIPLKLNWYSQPVPEIIEPAEEELVSGISFPVENEADTGDLSPVGVLEAEIERKVITEPQKDIVVCGDELRNLIQSHIKNAADQMADIHSIGTGKEFEVWLNNPGRSKFVGSTKISDVSHSAEESAAANTGEHAAVNAQAPSNPAVFRPRIVPPEVRKSCLILGIKTDNIVYEVVQDAWKKAIAAPGVHPDQGGDTEMAVYLNTAKDVLMRWLDAQAPKLGKKFGPYKTAKDAQPKKDKKKD